MILVEPNAELGLFILRLALGIVFLAHGPVKLRQPGVVAQSMDMKKNTILVVGFLETLGAVSMITGAWVQLGALFLAVVMLGAIYMKTQKWDRAFTREMGWELDFIILAALVVVFFTTDI